MTSQSSDAKGRRATVHPTALPSNDSGWPLDGGCMVGKLVSQWVRWFGCQFWSTKCMMVDPAICGSSTSILGSNRHGSSVVMTPGGATLHITWISDVASQVGHRVIPHGMWAHGPPVTSHCLLCFIFVHFCDFSCIQIIFPSTSGTM